jgi:hypothetical protein
VIDPVPTVLILLAVGETAPPLFPVRVSRTLAVAAIVMVLPDPVVVIAPVPKIFKTFPAGVADPVFASKIIGISV